MLFTKLNYFRQKGGQNLRFLQYIYEIFHQLTWKKYLDFSHPSSSISSYSF